jgi:hypothetical protein
MVKGVLVGFVPSDGVECIVGDKSYMWSKGDLVELMKVYDSNKDDPYYVMDIKQVKLFNVYNHRPQERYHHSTSMFRIWFNMAKDTTDGRKYFLTHMDINDMVVRMRDIKVQKLLTVNQS